MLITIWYVMSLNNIIKFYNLLKVSTYININIYPYDQNIMSSLLFKYMTIDIIINYILFNV